MKKTRYSEEKIVKILKEGDSGVGVGELCRKYGMSDATYYNWRKKYAGMEAGDVRELKALKEENQKLKKLLGEQVLEIAAIKDVLSKKW
jgi:putative transposase